ncbi:MAG: Fic family protein [Arenicella sp.]|nr:Fic family protein [Arenicella sp.]
MKIHPFADGNGRTARLLMNLDLLKSGFQPVIFKAADRFSYYEALDKAHTKNDYSDFLDLSCQLEKEALNKILSLVGGVS